MQSAAADLATYLEETGSTMHIDGVNGLALGIDLGSTTAKVVVIDNGDIVYEKYERHLSQVRQKTAELLQEVAPLLAEREFSVVISGSAGLGLAEAAGILWLRPGCHHHR
jgi:activator of 2-hydroxyglutaryl-CoA dehydratase